MTGAQPRIHEIHIRGCGDTAEALALQEPIARLLCPVERHSGPCAVPWGFSVDENAALVLGVYATRAKAEDVADRVRALVGEARPVALSEGDAGRFDELVQQYRIERGLRRPAL